MKSFSTGQANSFIYERYFRLPVILNDLFSSIFLLELTYKIGDWSSPELWTEPISKLSLEIK